MTVTLGLNPSWIRETVKPLLTDAYSIGDANLRLANLFSNTLSVTDGTRTGRLKATASGITLESTSAHNLLLNVPTGQTVGFQVNGSTVASIGATGLTAAAADTFAIGSASVPIQQMYWGDGTRVGRLAYSAGNNSLTIGSTTAHQVEFRVNSASVYYMDTSGNFKQDLASGGNMYLGKAATSLLIGGGANAIPSGISSAFGNPNLTIIGSNSSADNFALVGTGANAVGAHAYLAKTRTTDGQPTTAIQANDQLGRVAFWGAGGTNYRQGAYMESNVVSYTSDNNWDAHLDLAARSVSTLTVGLRVRNTGHVQVFKNAAAGAGAALINNCPAATLTAKWMEVYDESGNLGVIPLFLV